MRRLRLPGRAASEERGAIAVVVAILLGSGVLLGIGALVIDVGTIGLERNRLQDGADAAAWAVAASCATDESGGACTQPDTLAARYAKANAGDGSAGVAATVVPCGGGCAAVPSQAPCPAVTATPEGGIAQVATSTLNGDDSTLLPPVLARGLDPTYQGTTVVACSQVVWGVATRGEVLGFAIGECKWLDSVGPDPRNPAGTDVQVSLDQTCATGTAPLPPELAWLDGSPCARDLAVGDSVFGAGSTACGDALAAARDSGRPVLIPVVDTADSSGLHIAGLSGFVVTDYVLHDPGDIGGIAPPGCAADTTCITGHFSRIVVPPYEPVPGSSATDYGAAVLSRIS